MDTFRTQLQELGFRGDIAADEETLATYSRDWSLFTVLPAAVVYPRDTEDVSVVIRAANAAREAGEEVALTARSGGTDMTGGPLTESVVVDVNRYITHIGEIGRHRVTVGPGAFYRDFDAKTREEGLILPSYPGSREICTVGGMVANNAGGEKSLRYGKTQEYVEAVTMVLDDGTIHTFTPLSRQELAARQEEQGRAADVYRQLQRLIKENEEAIAAAPPDVSKNSAGYFLWNVQREDGTFDPTQIIVGSQGTLGIITEVTFRLVEPEPHSRMAVAFLSDIDQLDQHVQTLTEFGPETMEMYDDHTFRFALRYMPELMAQMKAGAIKLGWQLLPDLWEVVKMGGLPKLMLLAEFTAESEEAAAAQAKKAAQALADDGVRVRTTRSESENEKYLTIRRESFNLLASHVRGKRTAPFIEDIIVRPEKLPDFMPELYSILDEYELTYTVAGHAGDGNFHIIPLMDLQQDGRIEVIRELMDRVHPLIFKYNGSMTGEHNDGLLRSPYLRQMYGDDVYSLFEQCKEIFDPAGVFNPGKKVHASQDYAFEHIDTRPLEK